MTRRNEEKTDRANMDNRKNMAGGNAKTNITVESRELSQGQRWPAEMGDICGRRVDETEIVDGMK